MPGYQPGTETMQPSLIKYHLSDWQEMKKQTQAIKIQSPAILEKNFQKVLFLKNGPGSQKYYNVLNVKATKQSASFKELGMIIFCLPGQGVQSDLACRKQSCEGSLGPSALLGKWLCSLALLNI